MPLVVISGPLANKPFNGGAAWTRLSWTLGFRQLGWDVFFLECIASETCVPSPFEQSANLAFFRDVTQFAGLADSAALICDDGAQVYGASWQELLDLADSADLLINISGHLSLQPLFERFKRRVYLDLDPGYTQCWHANGDLELDAHDWYFTVGENIGSQDCSIPTGGIDWHAIPQPVVLDQWPVTPTSVASRFTTVASWRGPFGTLRHQGSTLGPKVHEFRKFIRVPQLVDACFELALDIHPSETDDLALLRSNEWNVVDPRQVVATPNAFRGYVQQSAAEFSVAQGVYVQTRCGWFSDRSTRYLASGKPTLVQDTGFSDRYPTGRGLLAFTTLEEAVDGANRIMRNYSEHCRAARAIAEDHFAARAVLSSLLHRVDLT